MSWTRRAIAAGVAALALSGTAACLGGSTPSPSPSTSPATVTPTATATTDPVAAAVLDTYRAYWQARVAAQADPTKPLPKDLTRFGRGTAVTDVEATVLLFRQQGIAMRGQPALAPKVTAVGQNGATITDCIDSSGWRPVYVATGKSALAPGQAVRVVMTSTATNPGTGWLIATVTVDRDRTC